MRPVPEALVGRAFTRREAHAAGVTDRMLQGRRFTAVHPGVYRTADTPPTFGLLASAALLVAPPARRTVTRARRDEKAFPFAMSASMEYLFLFFKLFYVFFNFLF